MSLFIPITKIDIEKRLVYGTLSEEVPDKSGEILDYETAKPAFQEWSQAFQDASGGKSFGNVRSMHSNIAAGKFTDIAFDDAGKKISGVAKIVDDDEWQKVLEGVYTGFSIGGGYARRWQDVSDPNLMRYTPILSEVSLVDNPAVPTATFEVIKQDGSIECRKFNLKHKENKMKNKDDYATHSKALLGELEWFEEYVKTQDEDDSDVLAHIAALQDYIANDADDDNEKFVKFADFKKMIAAMQKRINQLEAMPSPAKGAVRAVNKKGGFVAEMEKSISNLSTLDLIKMSLANPIEL